MSSYVVFPSKITTATLPLMFDFVSQLGAGETLASALVTVSLFSGIDATPSAILSGSASITGLIVTQYVHAGTAGVIYQLNCAVETSAGNQLIMTGLLAVTSTDSY